jgi:hypothetical protein
MEGAVRVDSGTGAVAANTAFGTVTDRQVTYFYKKGWFSGGSREDLPIRHITSVRLETARHPFWAVFLILIGLVCLFAIKGAAILVGLVLVALAALLLWGSPKVVVNTAGGDLRPATGFPWTRPEAERFVNALRSELFKKERA